MEYSSKIKHLFWNSLSQFQRNQIRTYKETMSENQFLDHINKRLDCFIRVRGITEVEAEKKNPASTEV